MSVGGLSEMLGMGLVIQLRNAFSIPALAVEKSSRALTNSILGDQKAINTGFRLMAGGASLMLLGTGMIAGLTAVSKHVLKASNDLEVLHNQINVLTHSTSIGDILSTQLQKFSTKTPFTIDQVFGAAKNLLAFGITADKVMAQMKITGEWAAMFPHTYSFSEAAAIIGKVKSGAFGQAMKSLRVAGIGYADIAKFGGPIDPKTKTTIKGADPDKFLDAVNKAIMSKFAGGMALYMTTIPGMLSNFQDQLILAAKDIGDQFKPALKDMLLGVLSVFKPELILPFAHALGQGLLIVLKLVSLVLVPLGHFVTWFMSLAKLHPILAKMIPVTIFLMGTLLNLTGAVMLAFGAFRILQFLFTAEKILAIGEAFLGMLGPIGWVIAALGLLTVIWYKNMYGLRDAAQDMGHSLSLVFQGMIALVSTLTGHVGTMPKTLADSLQKAGLLNVVVGLFQLIFRLKEFVMGLWEAGENFVNVLARIAGALIFVTAPVWGFVWALWKVAEGLGLVLNSQHSSVWHNWGLVIGTVASVFLGLRLAILAMNTALLVGQVIGFVYKMAVFGLCWIVTGWQALMKTGTAVQWAFNAALDANPIGIAIVAFGLLAYGAYLFFTHIKQISQWFQNLPTWAKLLGSLLGPITGLALGALVVYQNWNKIKSWFLTFALVLKDLWDMVIDYLQAKITGLWGWLKQLIHNAKDWFAGDFKTDFKDANGQQLTSRQLENLTRQQMVQLPANSPFTAAVAANAGSQALQARQPVVIPLTVHLDGKVIAKNTTRYQQDRHDGGNDSW